MPMMPNPISDHFPRYSDFDPLVPVWCVTPGEGRCMHRFFNSSPFSPSGRYMALFRLPQEERDPEPGEAGSVVLVDLASGEERVVAESRGWEPQLGANVQWGESDQSLFFNDVDPSDWSIHAVRLNPLTGEKRLLPGGGYHVSPDGQTIASP
ncbi:MAG: TolB-like translocation protein, partial [Planctomycetota bacterium]